MTMAVEVIKADKLNFSYGSERVLDDSSFAVYEGDFVAIIGANGAGKSTLMRLLLGELHPDSGSIFLFGQNILRFKNWSAIGYVAQNGTGLAEDFPASVREVVAMGAYSKCHGRAIAKQNIAAALKQVGMSEHSSERIGRLSGGQIQRVLVARALAGENRLLILDEPTTGVDRESSAALYTLLRQLGREKNITIIMVTHDAEHAAPFVTRRLILAHGKLTEG